MKTNQNAKRIAVLSAALAASTFGLCSTYAQDQTNPPSNTTGQKMDNAMDRAGDATKRGMDKAGDAMQRGADRTADAAKNMGNRMGGALSASTSSDVRNTVATATEAALTKGGLDDLVERFSQADRDRLGKDAAITGEHAKLDGRIAQFQKDWKEKYNQDFSIAANRDTIYNDSFARMMTSDAGDAARTASDRMDATRRTGDSGMVKPSGSTPGAQGTSPANPSNEAVRTGGTGAAANESIDATNRAVDKTAANRTTGTQGASPANPSNEAVRTGGTNSAAADAAAAQGIAAQGVARDPMLGTQGAAGMSTPAGDAAVAGDMSKSESTRAVVSIPASHGLPEVNVPLVREGGTWKIDVPDNYGGVELGNNVLKHLTAANEMKAQWPADANEAYRAVTHHVLVAVLNADAQGAGMSAPIGTGSAGSSTGTGASGMGSTGSSSIGSTGMTGSGAAGSTGTGTGATGTGAGTHTGAQDTMPK